MSAADAEPRIQLELRTQGKVLPGIVHSLIAGFCVCILMVFFIILAQPGVLLWLVAVPPVVAVAMLAGNPERRRVSRVDLAPRGIYILTKGGRLRTLDWTQQGFFLDIVDRVWDGTATPGPMVHWGKLGLVPTPITTGAAGTLLSQARGHGLRVQEAEGGEGESWRRVTQIRGSPR